MNKVLRRENPVVGSERMAQVERTTAGVSWARTEGVELERF